MRPLTHSHIWVRTCQSPSFLFIILKNSILRKIVGSFTDLIIGHSGDVPSCTSTTQHIPWLSRGMKSVLQGYMGLD